MEAAKLLVVERYLAEAKESGVVGVVPKAVMQLIDCSEEEALDVLEDMWKRNAGLLCGHLECPVCGQRLNLGSGSVDEIVKLASRSKGQRCPSCGCVFSGISSLVRFSFSLD